MLIMVFNRLDLSFIQFFFLRVLPLTISIILVLSGQSFSKDALTRFQSYRLLKNSNGVGQCALTSPYQRITPVRSSIRCSGHCSQDENCSQFNFRSKEFVCELFNLRMGQLEFTNVSSFQCSHYINVWRQRGNWSGSGNLTGTGSGSNNVSGSGGPGWNGSSLTNWTWVLGSIPSGGMFELTPPSKSAILVQNNVNTPNAFNRSWLDFEKGFQDSSGNYWMGNDAFLQAQSSYTGNILPTTCYLHVIIFPIGSPYPSIAVYTLSSSYSFTFFGSTYPLALVAFVGGNASDGLYAANGVSFSTYDRDNDIDLGSCARRFGSGWWYSGVQDGAALCGKTALNGHGTSFIWGDSSSKIQLASSQMWMDCQSTPFSFGFTL